MSRLMFGIIFTAIMAGCSILAADEHEEGEFKLYPADKTEWKDGPASLPPGAKIAVLEGDPTKPGPFVFRVKVPDGFRIPLHTHPKTERVTVIQGTFNIGMAESKDLIDDSKAQAMAAGTYGHWAAGMKHFVFVKGETIAQFHGDGPWVINYVDPKDDPRNQAKKSADTQSSQATFGLGCFSCAEAMFEQLKGVESADPGYSGGTVENPSYKQVTSGLSGHAEVVHINYDPSVISYDELLQVFWKMHDPTTLNRQGTDVGSQYRSVVFYHNEQQKELAERYKQKLEDAGAFSARIVTEVKPFKAFYKAEKEHLDFYRLNPEHQYCKAVIRPKMDKFKAVFGEKIRAAETGAASK